MEKQKRGTASKIVSIVCIVLCVFLAPILICNSVLIIKGLVDKTTVPSFFGFSPLTVETNSMVPTFSGGDLIIVQKTDTSKLQVKDVISFYEPSVSDHSVIVTHRIVEIIENTDGTRSFVTQGDANNAKDSASVKDSEVVGIYLTHIKGMGNFISFLSSTKGMILFVVLPLVLVFGTDSLLRAIDDKKRKKQIHN